MTELLRKAVQLAKDAHANQIDKGGHPYIDHPMAIADRLDTEEEKIVALLHDTVEDTYLTLEMIANLGFCDYIVHAIDCLTRRSSEDYQAYIRRIKGNSLARTVKVADIEHNMDLTRLKYITDADRKRIAKYEKSLATLKIP